MKRKNTTTKNYKSAREHLFNYNMELCGIRNQYACSSSKIEQAQLRHRLDLLLFDIYQDPELLDVDLNIDEVFSCTESSDLVVNLSKAYELMVSIWDELSVCD